MKDLENKYNSLRQDHEMLKLDFNNLNTINSKLQNYTNTLEHELASIKQLKNIADLQMLLNVSNEATTLKQKLQTMDNKLNAVTSDVNARKQDFIALYNTEQKIEQKQISLENTFNLTNMRFQSELQLVQNWQNQSNLLVNEKIEALENVTSSRLDKAITDMSVKVAVTACSRGQTMSSTVKATFEDITTAIGITEKNVTEALAHEGTFTVEKSGLYMISVFIASNDGDRFDLYRNENVIAYGHFFTKRRPTGTSSVTVLQELKRNDEVYVKAYDTMQIYGQNQSCISFLKI